MHTLCMASLRSLRLRADHQRVRACRLPNGSSLLAPRHCLRAPRPHHTRSSARFEPSVAGRRCTQERLPGERVMRIIKLQPCGFEAMRPAACADAPTSGHEPQCVAAPNPASPPAGRPPIGARRAPKPSAAQAAVRAHCNQPCHPPPQHPPCPAPVAPQDMARGNVTVEVVGGGITIKGPWVRS